MGLRELQLFPKRGHGRVGRQRNGYLAERKISRDRQKNDYGGARGVGLLTGACSTKARDTALVERREIATAHADHLGLQRPHSCAGSRHGAVPDGGTSSAHFSAARYQRVGSFPVS